MRFVLIRSDQFIRHGGKRSGPERAPLFTVYDPVSVPGDPITRGEIIEHCRQRLAEYKLPRIIAFVEALPATFAGKMPANLPLEEDAYYFLCGSKHVPEGNVVQSD